ncbi:MAG: hypothetical protein HGB11_06060, partial [Chlorobiales bacterium]|nr:hypothetical protein [Chlorobiales bacterium]
MKRYTDTELKCNHCGNLSRMIVKADCIDQEERRDDHTGQTWEVGDLYSIVECPACHNKSITVSAWSDSMDNEDEYSYEVLYPLEEGMPVGLPEKIKKGYESANKVKSIDANAYGVLMRRILELICEDRNAEGDNLYKKLEYL